MSDSTRRGFLKFAGAGAAAAGAAAVLPAAAAHAAAPDAVALPKQASGPLVAYITDVRSGELSVMVEGREVTVTDHQLVAQLAHAMHAGKPTSA